MTIAFPNTFPIYYLIRWGRKIAEGTYTDIMRLYQTGDIIKKKDARTWKRLNIRRRVWNKMVLV